MQSATCLLLARPDPKESLMLKFSKNLSHPPPIFVLYRRRPDRARQVSGPTPSASSWPASAPPSACLASVGLSSSPSTLEVRKKFPEFVSFISDGVFSQRQLRWGKRNVGNPVSSHFLRLQASSLIPKRRGQSTFSEYPAFTRLETVKIVLN